VLDKFEWGVYNKEGIMSFIGKIRPQILVSWRGGEAIALYGLSHEMVEVATACIGGVTGLGFKILEAD
jgi:hypothetical protein